MLKKSTSFASISAVIAADGNGSGPRRMADFLEHQVWVTAYKENEMHPAGEYPNTRGIKDGIVHWASNNEEVIGKDGTILALHT